MRTSSRPPHAWCAGSQENGFGISLAAARLLARLQDDGPTRISEARGCGELLPANDHQPCQAPRGRASGDRPPTRATPGVDDQADQEGQPAAVVDARSFGTSLEPYLPPCPDVTSRRCATRAGDAAPDGGGEWGLDTRDTASRTGREDRRVPALRHRHALGTPLRAGRARSVSIYHCGLTVQSGPTWDTFVRKWSSTFSDAG